MRINCPHCLNAITLLDSQQVSGAELACGGCGHDLRVVNDTEEFGLIDVTPFTPRRSTDPYKQEGVVNLLEASYNPLADIKRAQAESTKETVIKIDAIDPSYKDGAITALKALQSGEGVMLPSLDFTVIDDPEMPEVLTLHFHNAEYKVLNESPLVVQIDYLAPNLVKHEDGQIDVTMARYSMTLDGPMATHALNRMRMKKDIAANAALAKQSTEE